MTRSQRQPLGVKPRAPAPVCVPAYAPSAPDGGPSHSTLDACVQDDAQSSEWSPGAHRLNRDKCCLTLRGHDQKGFIRGRNLCRRLAATTEFLRKAFSPPSRKALPAHGHRRPFWDACHTGELGPSEPGSGLRSLLLGLEGLLHRLPTAPSHHARRWTSNEHR